MLNNNKNKTTRLQFELSETRLKELEALMNLTGASTRKELINNAITLFEWAVGEGRIGNTVGSISTDKKTYKEVVMPLLKNSARKGERV